MTSKDGHPTHPRAFGEELRRLRSNSGLEIDDISAETKISRRVLDALESGKFQYLPESVFSRSFVRQYARTIGYDEERLVTAFDEAWERFQLTSGTHPALVIVEAPPKEPIHWRFWFPIAAGVVILLIVVFLILTGSEPGEELLPDPRRAFSAQARPEDDPAGAAAALGTVPVQRAVSVASDTISITVRVQDEKECWIQYRDREGMTDQRLLRGGQEIRLELRGPVKFTVGNAGAATILVGDTEYRDLGLAGQVIHTEVSRDGLIPLGAGARYD
jgi:cytoskeletal protein RodZ